jgi:4-amino-4-deoxy-L-arabinose transferase-like glycosyltransferase
MDRPLPPNASHPPTPRRAGLLALGLLVFLGSLVYFSVFAQSIAPVIAQEYKFIQAARTMLDTGDYILPLEEGEPRLEKPPLSYWLIAGACKLLGPRLYAYRFPSVLATSLTVLIIALLGALVFDRGTSPSSRSGLSVKTGLLAAVILATSVPMFDVGVYAITDGLLTFCITASFAALIWATRPGRPSPAFLALAWLFLALALLAKGPIALVVLLGALAWVRLRLKQPLLKKSQLLLGLTVAIAPTVLWLGLIWMRLGLSSILDIVGEVLHHSTGQTRHGFFDRFDYVEGVIKETFPWSGLLFLIAVSALRRRSSTWPSLTVGPLRSALLRRSSTSSTPSTPSIASIASIASISSTPVSCPPDHQRIATTLLWGWMATAFLSFFLLFGFEVRMRLILPMFPPLALLAARTLVAWLETKDRATIQFNLRILGAFIAVPSALGLLLLWHARTLYPLPAALWIAAAICTALGLALQAPLAARNPWQTLVGLGLVWMAACCAFARGDVFEGHFVYPARLLRQSARALAAAYPPGRKLYFLDTEPDVGGGSRVHKALGVAANLRIDRVRGLANLPRPEPQTTLLCFAADFQSLPKSRRALWKPVAELPYWGNRKITVFNKALLTHWYTNKHLRFVVRTDPLLVLEPATQTQ